LGAGEILLTAVDREGTRCGVDIDMVRAVSNVVSVPVIVSGGMGSIEHFIAAAEEGRADAIAIADVLHYKRMSIGDIRAAALAAGLPVRKA
jgi:imidazole glycerol-phosphate synthase subunit HisF